MPYTVNGRPVSPQIEALLERFRRSGRFDEILRDGRIDTIDEANGLLNVVPDMVVNDTDLQQLQSMPGLADLTSGDLQTLHDCFTSLFPPSDASRLTGLSNLFSARPASSISSYSSSASQVIPTPPRNVSNDLMRDRVIELGAELRRMPHSPDSLWGCVSQMLSYRGVNILRGRQATAVGEEHFGGGTELNFTFSDGSNSRVRVVNRDSGDIFVYVDDPGIEGGTTHFPVSLLGRIQEGAFYQIIFDHVSQNH